MGILAWIIFGALAGWIASLLMSTNEEQGAFMNIVVGIAGAMIGGFGARLLGANGVTGFNLSSLFIAIIGSVVLLGIYKAVSHRA